MKDVNIFLADGFEEIEALAVRDVLVRGGVKVNLVSISDEYQVCSSHGVTVVADTMLEDCLYYGCGDLRVLSPEEKKSPAGASDVMIFPGGMPGSRRLGECESLISAMNDHYREGGTVAAICAAPSFVLSQLEGIAGAEFTCYDGCEANLVEMGARFSPRPAVVCGRIITGRGPGHAIDFGLAILRALKGDGVADSVRDAMILPTTKK